MSLAVVYRLVLLAALSLSCRSSEGCQSDSDCSSGVCFQDLERGDSYCTRECDEHEDCTDTQACQAFLIGEEATRRLCIELIRSCGPDEFCNGLDDDCDGQVDDDCEILPCFEDAICGEFVCGFTEAAGETLSACIPPVGERLAGEPCSQPADCYNNACAYGLCASVCGTSECLPGESCVSAGRADDDQLSVCLTQCGLPSFVCTKEQVCRVLPNENATFVASICSPPVGKGQLGEACDASDDCATGLCLDFCTELCEEQDCPIGSKCKEDTCPLGSQCQERTFDVVEGVETRVPVCVFF